MFFSVEAVKDLNGLWKQFGSSVRDSRGAVTENHAV